MFYERAVSYTHLDVYKRQICEKACKIPGGTVFTWESEGEVFEFTSDDDVTMCPYLEGEIAVSYTHLRGLQPANGGAGGCCESGSMPGP